MLRNEFGPCVFRVWVIVPDEVRGVPVVVKIELVPRVRMNTGTHDAKSWGHFERLAGQGRELGSLLDRAGLQLIDERPEGKLSGSAPVAEDFR